jgi:hypothetical protein
MKNRFYVLMVFCSVIFIAQNAKAQVRYHDMIFDSVSISTVTYSNVWSVPMLMDIYQPVGDTAAHRPVIVLAHGGSFIPPTDRTGDNTITTLCTNFAKRGYVTASIDYRLDTAIISMGDSATAANTVLKAISDGKSAIRYFRQDAYTANNYKIDTNIIFVGGNSAGAVLFVHVAYITNVNETSPAFQAVINANGGLDGNSGNPGYSSRVSGVINCAGGLNDPNFIRAGIVPSANFQGNQDMTVPYNCGDPESGFVPVRLCGLGVMEPLYQEFCVRHTSIVYPGAGHVPWATNATELTQVDTTAAYFLDSIMLGFDTVPNCQLPSAINNVVSDQGVKVFPNPVSSELNISFVDISSYQKVQLIDATGRLMGEKNVDSQNLIFNRSSLSSGIYFVKIFGKDGSYSVKKVMFD